MAPYRRSTPDAAHARLAGLTDALESYRRARKQLSDGLAAEIRACLEAGATWGEIGERLGTTKQGARARWMQVMNDPRSTPGQDSGECGAGDQDASAEVADS
jgi:hypothetical protein